MPIKKCTIIFNQALHGWTESYYRENDSTNLQLDLLALRALVTKRMPLSGGQTYAPYLKISVEGTSRDVLPFSYASISQPIPRGNVSQPSDVEFTAALLKRLTAGNAITSNLPIRGIWDSLTVAEGFAVTDPGWLEKFNEFRAQLLSNGWGFVGKDPAQSVDSPITGAVIGASGQWTITTENPILPFADPLKPFKVFISGIVGPVTLNGTQVLQQLTATTARTKNRIPGFTYVNGGKLTYTIRKFHALDDVLALRLTRRPTGAPLYQLRGRSRAKKLA